MKNKSCCAVKSVILYAVLCVFANTLSAASPKTNEARKALQFMPTLAPGKTWRLIWSDEFNGTEIDQSKWEILGDWQRKGGYWVKEDAYLDGDGNLVLRTKKDGDRYTSGAVRTKGRFEHRFGYWVARCKFPEQQGHWPAFWLFANPGVGTVGNEGRDGTEIDIMEKFWPAQDIISQNLHWDGYGADHKHAGKDTIIPGVSEGWHTFGLHWKTDEYVFYVDGQETWRTSAGGVSQVPQYAKLTEEIAAWAGDIGKAQLPDFFTVDYVRVYDTVEADVSVSMVGQWGGECTAVAVSGNLAYAGLGPSLVILDISEPANPIKLGQTILPDMVAEVAVSDTHAYVTDNSGNLHIVDTSNPSAPVCPGSCKIGDFVHTTTILHNYAYVVGWYGIYIVDISNPAQPVQVGSCRMDAAMDIAVAGNRAYVADYDTGLQVLDISDVNDPKRLGGCDPGWHGCRVAVSDGYAYVADCSEDLKIVDVSDPCNPELAGDCNACGQAEDVEVVGNRVYVVGWDTGLQIVDVSDHTSPLLLGRFDKAGFTRDVAIEGSHAYVCSKDGLHTVDISDPANPVWAGQYRSSGSVSDVEVVGSYGYVVDWDQLLIIDITDPADPTLVGVYDECNDPSDVAVVGGYAYLTDQWDALHIIDVSDPTNPTRVGKYKISGRALGVDVASSYAYVALGEAGLRIVDISDPYNPRGAGGYDTPCIAYDVAVSGSYAYVCDFDSLEIFNISNRAAPAWVASYDTEDGAGEVSVSGHYAYVATGQGRKLQIIDISDPASPVGVYGYRTNEGAWAVSITDDFAYLADGNPGVQIIDISNPSNPVEISGYDTCYAQDLAVSGRYIYVADMWGGLAILDLGFLVIGYVEAAIAEKAEALQKINAATNKKWEAYDALELMLQSKDFDYWSRGDILSARWRIRYTTFFDKLVKKMLETNLGKLREALTLLGVEPVERNLSGISDSNATARNADVLPQEFVISCIEEAVALKAEALERIDAALEQERRAYEVLEQLLTSGGYGNWDREDVLRAKLKIYLAKWNEHYSRRVLAENIRSLERVLTKSEVEMQEGADHELEPLAAICEH